MKPERDWEEREMQSPLKVLAPFFLIVLALLAWGVFSS
jgi:hypothetical protein